MQVLSAILLFITHFLNTLLDHLNRSRENREEVLDVHENDESISDLNVVLGAEAVDDGFGDFEMPLVADVAEVLEANVVIGVRRLEKRSSQHTVSHGVDDNLTWLLTRNLVTKPGYLAHSLLNVAWSECHRMTVSSSAFRKRP